MNHIMFEDNLLNVEASLGGRIHSREVVGDGSRGVL